MPKIKAELVNTFNKKKGEDIALLLEKRYRKFRKIGEDTMIAIVTDSSVYMTRNEAKVLAFAGY